MSSQGAGGQIQLPSPHASVNEGVQDILSCFRHHCESGGGDQADVGVSDVFLGPGQDSVMPGVQGEDADATGRERQSARAAHNRLRDSHSDPLSALKALIAYQAAASPAQFCS